MLPDFNIKKYKLPRNILKWNGFRLSDYDNYIRFSLSKMKERTREKRESFYSRYYQEFSENFSRTANARLIKVIRKAAKEHVRFPQNHNEYIKLLRKIRDETNFFINYIRIIVIRSANQNIMKTLYIILHDNREIVIKLIELDNQSSHLRHYVLWAQKLIDNNISCMRVLLACCIIQNKNSTSSSTLLRFSDYAFRLDSLSAFVTIVILKNMGCVRGYIPNPYVFYRIDCQICKGAVSFSGCYCENSKAPLKPNQECTISMDPLDDSATNSDFIYFESWELTLKFIEKLKRRKKISAKEALRRDREYHRYQLRSERPLIIRDFDTTTKKKECKSKDAASTKQKETLPIKRKSEDTSSTQPNTSSTQPKKPIHAERESENVQFIKQNEPMIVDHEEPITVDHEESITVDQEERITVDHKEPITVHQEEPITVDHEEPLTVDHESENVQSTEKKEFIPVTQKSEDALLIEQCLKVFKIIRKPFKCKSEKLLRLSGVKRNITEAAIENDNQMVVAAKKFKRTNM